MSAPFEFRFGTDNDIEAMALLAERTNADRAGNPLPKSIPEDSEDYSDLRLRKDYKGYWSHLAFDGDRLAGFINGYPGTWKGEDDGSNSEYIWLLMVDPDYQRRGLGRTLLKMAARIAAKENADTIFLYVAKDNNVARELYESEGYVFTETVMSERQGELAKYGLKLR